MRERTKRVRKKEGINEGKERCDRGKGKMGGNIRKPEKQAKEERWKDAIRKKIQGRRKNGRTEER